VAILDRLLHDAEVLTINGPSYRLRGRLEVMHEVVDEKGGEAEGQENDRGLRGASPTQLESEPQALLSPSFRYSSSATLATCAGVAPLALNTATSDPSGRCSSIRSASSST
jgi:hypothetical protein